MEMPLFFQVLLGMSKSEAPLTVSASDLVFGASSGEGGAAGDAYALPDDFQVRRAPTSAVALTKPCLNPASDTERAPYTAVRVLVSSWWHISTSVVVVVIAVVAFLILIVMDVAITIVIMVQQPKPTLMDVPLWHHFRSARATT